MSRTRIAILAVLVLGLCCVVGALGVLGYRFFVTPAQAAAKPVVLIESPRLADEVTLGQITQIFATAQDETRIDRMELWVDGQHIETQRSALPGGTNPFPLTAQWTPATAGNHTIVVRAYNMADVSGQASISVNAVEGPDFPTEMPLEGCEGVPLLPHEVLEGETLEGIAGGFDVTVDEILACNPGLDPSVPLTPGQILLIPQVVSPGDEEVGDMPPDVPPLDGEDPGGAPAPPADDEPDPGADPPNPAPPAPVPPVPPVSPPPPTPIALEFEALQLQVNEQFMAVYCNVELQGNMERVPLDPHDFLAPTGLPQDNYWDIAAELGGVHSVPLAVLPGETVDLFVHCLAFFPMDIIPYDLGTVTRNHGEGDWHGNPIEAVSIDGEALPEGGDGEFKLVYRICQGDCEDLPVPEVPTNLELLWCPALQDYFRWSWAGDYPIEGFRLYKDGALLQQLADPAARSMQVAASDVQAPCEGAYEFTLTAYEGAYGVGAESAHSAPPVVASGETPCANTARVRFDALVTHCLTQDCPAPEPGPAPPMCSNCQVNIWYGSIHANDQWIEKGPPDCDPGGCYFPPPGEILHSFRHPFLGPPPPLGPPYPITGPGGVFDDDTVDVPLGATDDLTLGISLIDWDQHSGDDFMCEGQLTINHANVLVGYTDWVQCMGGDPPDWVALLFFTITHVF
jgi:LysM repeat protein